MSVDQPTKPIGHLSVCDHSEAARTTLIIRGSLTATSRVRLHKAIQTLISDGASPNVVLDFAGVGLFDHAGIGMLLELEQWLSRQGGELWVKNPNHSLRKTLDQLQRAAASGEAIGPDAETEPDAGDETSTAPPGGTQLPEHP